jgi:hypothetical protein
MEQLQNHVITLPEEWQRPATQAPAYVAAFQTSFQEQVTSLSSEYQNLIIGNGAKTSGLLYRLRTGKPLRSDEKTSYSNLLKQLSPLLNITSATVAKPDYVFDYTLLDMAVPRLLAAQNFARLASIYAMQQAKNGQYFKAMETAMLPIRYVKRPVQSLLMCHVIATAVANISSFNLASLADQCTDTQALRHGLQLMSEYRTDAFPGNPELWKFSASIGALRQAVMYGYPANLSPQTLGSYYRQSKYLYGKEFPEWIVQNRPASSPESKAAKSKIKELNNEDKYRPQLKISAENRSGRNVAKKFGGSFFDTLTGIDSGTLLAAMAQPQLDETETRTLTSTANYDLVRLRFAQRLADLEAHTSSTTSAPDISLYLSPVPLDPFSQAPFIFSTKRAEYYSVGPDRKNNNSDMIYDSTNGTVSSGDLMIEGRKD